jgi:hypothetical protein
MTGVALPVDAGNVIKTSSARPASVSSSTALWPRRVGLEPGFGSGIYSSIPLPGRNISGETAVSAPFIFIRESGRLRAAAPQDHVSQADD